MVRFCLRGLFASVFSQADNLSAKGSSLLCRSGTLNRGSTSSERRYLRMVFRDRPVLREISRIEKCSRKCQRRITLNNAMSITPYPLLKTSRGGSNMGQFSVEISLNAGSVLGGNQQTRHRRLLLIDLTTGQRDVDVNVNTLLCATVINLCN